jgi:MOSC domain-containing protein YiiM
MAEVTAVCVSAKRQEPKTEVGEARFLPGGIEGDSHRGVTEREVSLLRAEDILKAEKEAGFSFPPGSLAENLVVEGLPDGLAEGALLAVGNSVLLEVVEKGKKPGEPHSYDYRGWCLLPVAGYFLRVVRGGEVRKGDPVTVK